MQLKKLPRLSRRRISKHDGDEGCLNCLHLFGTKHQPKSHIKLYEIEDFCNALMPSEDI